MSEFQTKPNPDQPDRCPSIDPHDTLQCGRHVHEDDQCQFGGIAWKKGSPRHMSDHERAERLEAMCDRLAGRLADVREYVADPGNWSALDGRRRILLELIDAPHDDGEGVGADE